MLSLWTFFNGSVALLVVVWVAFRISNRHVLKVCRSVPSAQPCYPILGNSILFSWSIEEITKGVEYIVEETVLKGGRAVCFWLGAYPVFICVIDPNDIRKVLNNSLSRGKEVEESSSEYSKFGLLTSPVDHWKVTRRHLNLSFHPRNLEQLIPTFNSTSRQLVANLSKHVDGAVFNLMPYVMSAALRTIGIFLYGSKTMEHISVEEFEDLRLAVELAAELIALRVVKPWLGNDIIFKILYWRDVNRIKAAFRRISEIANNNSELVLGQEGGDSAAGIENTAYTFQTITDAMRDLKEKYLSLTDQQVTEESISFFATGTDTIGASVSSCLLALARFPHIQDKVYEEIRSVMSELDDQDIAHSDLKRFTYLDQVIKETLRFFIVVPFTTRSPNKDIDLGGYTVPANKTTLVCITSVIFDPKYFPEPHKFDPERFASPNSLEDVFIPFSRGPRNCIGKEYAMMLMKVAVVHVVRKYRLTTDMDIQNLKKKFTLTLICCDGYNVCLSERSN